MATAVMSGEKNQAMGSVMALLTMGHSLGMLAGSMGAGVMMELFQLRAAFPLGAVLMILGTLTFLFSTARRRPAGPGKPLPKLARELYTVYEEALGLHPLSEKQDDRHGEVKK